MSSQRVLPDARRADHRIRRRALRSAGSRRRLVVGVLAAVSLLTVALGFTAAPASAHVPPPIWSPDVVGIELPDVPTAIPAVALAAAERRLWTVDADGVVTAHDGAPHFGDLTGDPPDREVVALAATPSGEGYWLASSDGRVWAFGDAPELGDVSYLDLDEPIVTMAATSTGAGYWLAAADGGMFTLGDAAFHGSAAIYPLVSPIVGMGPTSTDAGYWLAAGDGGVFTFGDATFHGSMGAVDLDGDIVAMAPAPDDAGYWLAGADGGVFTFGSAEFAGSAVGEITGSVSDMVVVDGHYVMSVDSSPLLPSPEGLDADGYLASLKPAQVAIWDAMADCESGGRWDINTGNGYFGGLQFSAGSWLAVGGSGLPHEHDRVEQIYRGALLQQRQGWGAWPGCSHRLGLL